VQKDIEHTGRDFDAIKAGYVADAAMAWAISAAKQEPAFTCSTHDTTGTTITANGGADCNDSTHFTGNAFKFDTNANIGKNPDGWLETTVATANGSSTLSGAEEETLKFKIWFPTESEMRITATGIVNGKSKTIQLIGDF